MIKYGEKVIRGYINIIVLTILLIVILHMIWSGKNIIDFINNTATEWASLAGIIFTVSIAMWLTYVNVSATEFGDYLRLKKAAEHYSNALLFQIIVHFTTTVMLIIALGVSNSLIATISMYLLMFSLVNIITMMNNARDLMKLYNS